MRRPIPLLLAVACFYLTGCKVNRYYYIAEEPIALYELPSFNGQPILTTAIGDTVSATGTETIQLGGPVPVEFAGYRFYSPSARSRFLRVAKVRPRRDAFLPGITYRPRQQYRDPADGNGTPANYGYTPTTGAIIHTGPRGGRYYYNSKGNKTYVPRSSSSRSTSSSYRSPSRSSRSTSSSYRSPSRSSPYKSSGSSYRSSSSSRGRH
jgi:hypothetical protein